MKKLIRASSQSAVGIGTEVQITVSREDYKRRMGKYTYAPPYSIGKVVDVSDADGTYAVRVADKSYGAPYSWNTEIFTPDMFTTNINRSLEPRLSDDEQDAMDRGSTRFERQTYGM